jgi:hypothetical protein
LIVVESKRHYNIKRSRAPNAKQKSRRFLSHANTCRGESGGGMPLLLATRPAIQSLEMHMSDIMIAKQSLIDRDYSYSYSFSSLLLLFVQSKTWELYPTSAVLPVC